MLDVITTKKLNQFKNYQLPKKQQQTKNVKPYIPFGHGEKVSV